MGMPLLKSVFIAACMQLKMTTHSYISFESSYIKLALSLQEAADNCSSKLIHTAANFH